MSGCAIAGPAVMAAWRRYRHIDQGAWNEYQASAKAAFGLLQDGQRQAYDRCETDAMASMAMYGVTLRAWYAAENGIETGDPDGELTDPDTAWDDHLQRVSHAVRHRESQVADLRAAYRAACDASMNAYQMRLIRARHQWLDACGQGSDPYGHR